MIRREHLLCGALLACVVSFAIAEDLDKQFRAAKAKLVLELKSVKADIRAAAVKKFAAFPTPEAAQTLLQQGAASQDAEVRRGCFVVLRSFCNSPAVAQAFQKEVLRDLKRDKVDETLCVQFNCLLSAEDTDCRALAEDVLREAEKSVPGLLLLAETVDQLSDIDDDVSQATILRLADSAPAASHPGFRRAVIQALASMRRPEAVSSLLAFHAAAEGETRADIERRLEELSGLKAINKPDWAAWWEEKRTVFAFPEKSPRKRQREREEPARGGPSYYGLPLYGSRLIFVIDVSGSMRGGRLEAAKTELLKAIRELPDGVQFNVLAYSASVVPWKRELTHVSAATKEDAGRFVYGLVANANTASYDALEAALKSNADAIYFLTDGAPNGGKTSNPAEIVALISRANRLCRATINTIGIAEGNSSFLKSLAERNFGVYRELK